MLKSKNLVTCNFCEHWDTDRHFYHKCKYCKSTGQVPDPEEQLCNLCGECLCYTYDKDLIVQNPNGLVNAKILGGYYSYHLSDMNTYIFSLCEKCLRNLFVQCKIKPEIYNTRFQDGELAEEISWEKDQSIYEERVWQDSKMPHQNYLNKKCNSNKDCPNDAVYSIFFDDDYEEGTAFTENTSCEDHKYYWKNNMGATLKPYVSNTLKIFL